MPEQPLVVRSMRDLERQIGSSYAEAFRRWLDLRSPGWVRPPYVPALERPEPVRLAFRRFLAGGDPYRKETP